MKMSIMYGQIATASSRNSILTALKCSFYVATKRTSLGFFLPGRHFMSGGGKYLRIVR